MTDQQLEAVRALVREEIASLERRMDKEIQRTPKLLAEVDDHVDSLRRHMSVFLVEHTLLLGQHERRLEDVEENLKQVAKKSS